MTDIPDWIVERNARFAAEREARDLQLRADGFRIISVVAAYDSRTKHRPITTSMGETESLVIVNPPADCLKHGIHCVIVGPDSEIIEAKHALEAHQIADEKHGVAITVFKGQRPR